MSEQPQVRDGLCPDDDALVELALGQADRQACERIAGHLAVCAGCRRSYDDLAGAVELVLPAVPRVAPPPAFEATALSRIDEARTGAAGAVPRRLVPGDASVPPSPARRGVRRRTVLWAAAAAVLGVAAGAGVTAYLDEEEPVSAWSRPLLTADGATVGQVSPTLGEGGHMLVIDVTAPVAGRRYTCRLRRMDGSSEDIGVWNMAGDRPNSWVVPLADPEDVRAVELVGQSGNVWSSARL
jgi:hypothetical protein